MKVLTLYHLHKKIAECDMHTDQEIIIGRGEDCNITINDTLISRKHLRLFFENNSWNIECLSRFSQLKGNDGQTFSKMTVDEDSDFEFWMANYKICMSLLSAQEDSSDKINSPEHNNNNTALMVLPDPSLENQLESSEQEQENEVLKDSSENFDSNATNSEGTSFMAVEDVQNKELSSVDSSNLSVDISDANAPPESEKKDDHERTQLVQQGLHSSPLEARLKILKKIGEEDIFILEGTKWTIGRSEDCEITLNHPKVSRSHCEIVHIQDEYYIKDLKSSNGTSLNSKKISHIQATLLHSGDRINIEDLMICFEICNVDLEKKLEDLEEEENQKINPPNTFNDLPSEPLNKQISGVIRIPSTIKSSHNKKKKLIRIAMFGLIAIIGYSLIVDNSEQVGSRSESSKTDLDIEGDDFRNLTPEQKSIVVNSYQLALKMFNQEKFSIAFTEVQKIHELVSSGYKNSKEIERDAEAAVETLKQVDELRQIEERKRQLEREVTEIVNRCERESQSYIDAERLQSCLEPAIEKDPDNAKIQLLIEKMNHKIAESEKKNRSRARYLANVRAGKRLYEKAKALHDKEQLLDAIDGYQKHVNAKYPDPDKLKDKSKKLIDQIRKTITDKIIFYQDKADEKVKVKDYRMAVLFLKKSLDLDPSLSSSKKKIAEYSEKLTKQMKILYAESVLEESLGHLEDAKKKWQDIVKLDLRDGEYYKKARIKLKKYEL